MAYILGEREFWGLPFKVSPAVLVPRPDSETVIEAVLALDARSRRAPGASSISASARAACCSPCCASIPRRSGVGLEASPEALAVAQENADSAGRGRRGRRWSPAIGAEPGWGEALGGPFDLVVSNPPYIAAPRSPG